MKKIHFIPLWMRLIIFFSVIVIIAVGLWVWWMDGISAPDKNNSKPQVFVISINTPIREIASDLSKAGLIRSPTTFFLLIKYLGLEKDIQAGDFRLNPSMDAKTVATELTHGMLDSWVTTLEGWRIEEIAMELSKTLRIPEKEFIAHAKEGYMFPDTYLIPRDTPASQAASLFIKTFNNKIPEEQRKKANILGISFDDAVIFASLVEREGRSDSDRPIIAGILLKRLMNDWPLQVDATLQYALGFQQIEKTWWKKVLTEEDKTIDSLYNTYINKGLPPAPICNPGLSSINAVLSPVDSEYWYYLHDAKGAVHYATTLEEHEENIQKYL